MKVFKNPNIKGYLREVYFNFFQSKYSLDSNRFGDIQLEKLTGQNNLKLVNEKYLLWTSPCQITNSFISISQQNGLISIDQFEDLLKFFTNNLCKHLALYFNGYHDVKSIETLLNKIDKQNIHSILIICDFHEHYFSDEFGEIIMNLSLNKKLVVLESPFEKNFEDTMFFTEKTKINRFNKSVSEFKANITLFSESQLHHTYFNRKLYIGPNGEIKNAPECEDSFGCIQDLNSAEQLKEIIHTPEFQKYWFVHKEILDVCKDCEFRHMCVDNRLPYKRSEKEWYHKIECNYNPYIAKWEGEEGYKTLEECGVISNESGFSIDHDKIAKVNAELWSE